MEEDGLGDVPDEQNLVEVIMRGEEGIFDKIEETDDPVWNRAVAKVADVWQRALQI